MCFIKAVSRQMAVAAIRSVMIMLQKMMPLSVIQYQKHNIQNVVANIQIQNVKSIDLKGIYEDYSTFCTYQSSIFPGLIFRPENSPIVLLIFSSCRVVVTGGVFLLCFACTAYNI